MGGTSASKFSGIEYVFLDRDGVLNRAPAGGFVTRWEQFELLPGVEEAIATLNRSGRKLIVVTNQRCVALGLCSSEQVTALHQRLQKHLAERGARLDAIYFCPHAVGECNCRKPLPGLFEQAFRDFPGACAGNSVMVGDSPSDIEAGSRLEMRTLLISDEEATSAAARMADAVRPSLLEFVRRDLALDQGRA